MDPSHSVQWDVLPLVRSIWPSNLLTRIATSSGSTVREKRTINLQLLRDWMRERGLVIRRPLSSFSIVQQDTDRDRDQKQFTIN
mgnify:CR=1 FL=1